MKVLSFGELLWDVYPEKKVIGGAALYFAVNTVLKMPFSSAFLDSGTVAAHLVRVLRYAVVIFVTVGVYPMLFKLTAKIGAKKAPEET